MNCVLIETDQGRYCDSHRTWHHEEPSYFVPFNSFLTDECRWWVLPNPVEP